MVLNSCSVAEPSTAASPGQHSSPMPHALCRCQRWQPSMARLDGSLINGLPLLPLTEQQAIVRTNKLLCGALCVRGMLLPEQ
jgi:hypothetical protein